MIPVVTQATHTHVSSTISPQASIQEEPETEVIGAGLPLMQRLKLLQTKEEKDKNLIGSQLRVSFHLKMIFEFDLFSTFKRFS